MFQLHDGGVVDALWLCDVGVLAAVHLHDTEAAPGDQLAQVQPRGIPSGWASPGNLRVRAPGGPGEAGAEPDAHRPRRRTMPSAGPAGGARVACLLRTWGGESGAQGGAASDTKLWEQLVQVGADRTV